jgi:Protein of unknown function (DUF3175)
MRPDMPMLRTGVPQCCASTQGPLIFSETPMPSKRARKWSGEVTKKSEGLDLEGGIFASNDPHEIAASLKRSSEKSQRRKPSSYRSAMSMLTFYINRAGRNLSAKKGKTLEAAKDALRKEFGRDKK